MVIPFLITVSGSTTNSYDYQRFRPIPRFLYKQEDRYIKGLTPYFNKYNGWSRQLQAYFPKCPLNWSSWENIGDDISTSDALAAGCLTAFYRDEKALRSIAADYSEFTDGYTMIDTQVNVEQLQAIEYLRHYYEQEVIKMSPANAVTLNSKEAREKSLELLSEKWGIPFTTYFSIQFYNEMNYPMGFQSWYPPAMDPKYVDFLRLKNAYRQQMFLPGAGRAWKNYCETNNLDYEFPVDNNAPEILLQAWKTFKAEHAPASMAVPFALRAEWYNLLINSEKGRQLAGLPPQQRFTIETYNELAGTSYTDIRQTPFPIPSDFRSGIQRIWQYFLKNEYPLRLITIKADDRLQKLYAGFLQKEIKVLRVANELLGTNHQAWGEFKVSDVPPAGFDNFQKNERSLWMNFVKSLDTEDCFFSSSEIAYQKYLLKKYGNLETINRRYMWNLKCIEEAFAPFADAYTVTFMENESAFTIVPILANYRQIFDFLILNGNALGVTLLLIILTILATLTINPLCAYALSRFSLPGTSKVLLFMLATMAFPAMVSAIPAYLLMRDLGLLNTFFALVLPGAANGMAIFILKGFFDSLPQELYEAATIDGAGEMQIFRMVAMPMVKPILAINCVSAFIAAYNGWEWALIICQDKDMWTLAVWMYQASQWWHDSPWVISAGFVVISIPTMIVFLSCQKIILKGIVVPSMK